MVKRTFRIALYSCLSIILILTGFALFATRMAVYPWWYKSAAVGKSLPECTSYQQNVYQYCRDPKKSLDFEFEDFQNSKVTGWIIRAAKPKGTVILVHGGGADRRAMLKHASYLHGAGYDLMLIDCWNQGLTTGDGNGISFGLHESESIVAAVDVATQKNLTNPITVMGTSQGAFAALRAATMEPLIKAVIAENSYISVRRLLLEFPLLKWMPSLAKKEALLFLSVWLGESVDHLDVHAFAGDIKVPVLLIHGGSDVVVNVKQSQEILGLLPSSQKELYVVPKGNHEYIWNVAKEEYQAKVLDFLSRLR